MEQEKCTGSEIFIRYFVSFVKYNEIIHDILDVSLSDIEESFDFDNFICEKIIEKHFPCNCNLNESNAYCDYEPDFDYEFKIISKSSVNNRVNYEL